MTRYLGHGSKQKTVTGFLSLVTEAVWHLPALRTLELWNASDGFGCLFRCTLDYHRIIVKWRCTDERFTLEDEVIKRWTELAKASGRSLMVRVISLSKNQELNRAFKFSNILPVLQLRWVNFDPIYEANIVVAQKMKWADVLI
ncbi:hypothetical protein ACHAPZ_001569 [Fusarium culmorum]